MEVPGADTCRIIGDYLAMTIVPSGTWKENCYVVRHEGTRDLLVIDPGGDAERLVEVIEAQQGRLRYILLTHAHHDHVGAVAPLARRYGLPCRLHLGDLRLLRHAPMYAWRFAGAKIEPPSPILVHDEGAPLPFGGERVRVIHTPGHTAGSVCYLLSGVVFTGDTLLYRHTGRVDLPGADAEQIRQSVEQLIQGVPASTLILSGHGRPWSIGEARQWWKESDAGAAASEDQSRRPQTPC